MIITYVPNPTIKDDWSALTPVCFFTRFAVPQFTRQASPPPPPPSSSPPQPSRPPVSPSPSRPPSRPDFRQKL